MPPVVYSVERMLQATLALARRVDRGEIDFCARAARAGEANGAATLEIAGGRAVCGAFGSPWNKVLGLGLGVDVTDADLDAIEDFYDDRGVPSQIELCPLASAGLALRLNQRGFVLQGFENQLARTLDGNPVPEAARFDIVPTSNETEALWLRVVSEGFAEPEVLPVGTLPPSGDTQTLSNVMRQFDHPDIMRFLVTIDGEPAGAGARYISAGLLGIVGTATLPRFRRQGIHGALVARTINLALGRADLAIATTEPGSTSQRTFERFGFQVLYTRAVLTKG